MKHIKIIIFLLLLYSLTGCSYVSDYTEGLITKRASFPITAEYNYGTGDVDITWLEIESSEDFAGIEIYRSSRANDEYATYEMIAYRWSDAGGMHGSLNNGLIKQYTNDLEKDLDLNTMPRPSPGIYFYRIGFIHWDDSLEERDELGSGYYGTNPVYDQNTYNSKTSISKVSGYSRVSIP